MRPFVTLGLSGLMLVAALGCRERDLRFVQAEGEAELTLLLVYRQSQFSRALGPISDGSAIQLALEEDERLYLAEFDHASFAAAAPRLDVARLSELTIGVPDETCEQGRVDDEAITAPFPNNGRYALFDRDTDTFVADAEPPPVSKLWFRAPTRALECETASPRLVPFAREAGLGLGAILDDNAVTALDRDLVLAHGPAHLLVIPRGGMPIPYELANIRDPGATGPLEIFMVRAATSTTPGRHRVVVIGFDRGAREAGIVIEAEVTSAGLSVAHVFEGEFDVYDALFEPSGSYIVVGTDIVYRMKDGAVLESTPLGEVVDLRAVAPGRTPQELHVAGGGNGVLLAGDLFGSARMLAIDIDGAFVDSSIVRILRVPSSKGPMTVLVTIGRGAYLWEDDDVFSEFAVEVEPNFSECRGKRDGCGRTRLGSIVRGSIARPDGTFVVVPATCTAAAIYDVDGECTKTIIRSDVSIGLDPELGFISASYADGVTVIASASEVFELLD